MVDRTSLGHWVRRFLVEYAASERNLSANTCASYRDMLVLLLPYLATRKKAATDALSVTDLSPELVRSFLAYLEQERHCCTVTRNQRLASIHALARFVGEHSPEHVEWCAQIRMVPMKKGITANLTYLEKSEVDGLLDAPDQSLSQGRRDHALLLFLYNSGARVSEASSLRIGDIDWHSKSVRITGKGNKQRRCPLWTTTLDHLRQLAGHRPAELVDDLAVTASQIRRSLQGTVVALRKRLPAAAVGCQSVSRNPPFGCDGERRRHHRSPAMAQRPAGQDS
jgi:integrase/recombinase XerD